MKKFILITSLLAAGTMLANAASDELKVPTGGNYYAGNFEFTFCIESAADLSQGGELLATYGNYSGTAYDTNGFEVVADGDGFKLTIGNGSLSGVANDSAKITSSSAYEFVSDSTRYAQTETTLVYGSVYTVKNVGADRKQTVSLYSGETLIETLSYNGNMSNGTENSKIWSVGNSAYDVKPIPEPSAFGMLAGLGALALVASRRRRR